MLHLPPSATASSRSLDSRASNGSRSSDGSICSDDTAMKRPSTRRGGRKPPLMKKEAGVARNLGVDVPRKDPSLFRSKSLIKRMKRQHKRKVRFNETVIASEVASRADQTAEEKEQLYLTPNDMQNIRNDAKFVTKYFRVKAHESISELDLVYFRAIERASESTSEESFSRLLQAESGELNEEVATLHFWCSKAKVSARGLEKYCSQLHRTERVAFASESRQAVLRLYQSGCNAIELAKFYREYARSSTILARILGRADEQAAKDAVRQLEKKFRHKMGSSRQTSNASLISDDQNKTQIIPEERFEANRSELLLDLKKMPPLSTEEGSSQEAIPFLQAHVDDFEQSSGVDDMKPMPLPTDRRKLLLMSKQQSSSARLAVEALQKVNFAAAKRVDFV